ncbi:MAG: hypothetical protein GXY76_06430 [Chloroflexi bacterium]|nr:hypothetical protein [Chloroflexota bacterium]
MALSYLGQTTSLGSLTLRDLSTEQDIGGAVADFLLDRRSRGLSPRTVQYYELELRLFSAWLRWCWLEYDCEGRCPVDRVAPPRELLKPVETSTGHRPAEAGHTPHVLLPQAAAFLDESSKP